MKYNVDIYVKKIVDCVNTESANQIIFKIM